MAQTTVEPASRTSGITGVVVMGAAIAVLVAAGLTAVSATGAAAALGLPDPGTLTTLALPAVRVLAQVCMVLDDRRGAARRVPRAAAALGVPRRLRLPRLRAASWTAAGWATAALLMVPLEVAVARGSPVTEVLDVGMLAAAVPRVETATAWATSAAAALLVLVGARTVLTWGWTVVLFALAVIGPLPVALTGHSAVGGSHDIATDSLVLHVLATALWVGGLVAVLTVAAARSPDRSTALATAYRGSAGSRSCAG